MSYQINLIQKDNDNIVTTTDITQNTLLGFSIVEKLDSSLDIGSLTLRGLTTSKPYTMFDIIEIKKDNNRLHTLRIGGDSVSLISKRPKRYEHNLSLVEHTKILERFIVGAKTFTQPTDGTVRYYLYDVFQDLIDTVNLEVTAKLNSTRLVVLPSSGDLYDLLTTTEAPEFTFKNSTLRECFDTVSDYLDGISRLVLNSSNEMELTIDFVSEIKNLLASETSFFNKTETQEIDLYSQQIETEGLNLVNDKSLGESVEYYPSYGSYTSLRTEAYIFNFLNSYIPTPKPIYNMKQILALFPHTVQDNLGNYLYGSSSGNPALFPIRIINFVVEEEFYRTLPRLNADAITIGNYRYSKENTIPYKQFTKNVKVGQTSGVFGTQVNLEDVLGWSIYQMMIDDGFIDSSVDISQVTILADTVTEDIQETVFQVQYQPVPSELRLNIDRQDISDVNRFSTMITNQRARILNLENFANNIQGKINRIGNSDLFLEHRVSSINNLYDIGDYTDDLYIVTSKETIYYKDYIYAKYDLTKNFNKISSFIGVNSEVRQWEISEKNTLNRNLSYKEYIEIDVVSSGNGSSDSVLLTNEGIETYLDTFKSTSLLSQVKAGAMVGTDIANTINVPISSNGGGNTLYFSWNFENNNNVGNQLNDSTAQKVNDYVPYADENGISNDFTIYLGDELDTLDTTLSGYYATGSEFPQSNLTYITTLLLKNTTPFIWKKDSREVGGGTIGLNQISKRPNDVILGRYLSLRNRLISDNTPTSFKLYRYLGFQFDRTKNFKAPSGAFNITNITPTIDATNKKITFLGASSVDTSWCITDENDNILIAVNQDGTLLNTITFDFKNKRTGINYKY